MPGVYLLRNADNGRYLDADFGGCNVETSANAGDDDECDELAGAMANGLGTSGVGGPGMPFGPGETRSFAITGDDERLSVVSMIICTNDGFTGRDFHRRGVAPATLSGHTSIHDSRPPGRHGSTHGPHRRIGSHRSY